MNKFIVSTVIAITTLVMGVSPTRAEESHYTLGVGLHYWDSLDDVVDSDFEFEDSGYSLLVAWQWAPENLIQFEIDLEFFEDGFAGATGEAISPMVLVLLDLPVLYVGAGVGVTISDDFDSNVSDPFYLARAGFHIGLLPRLGLDLHLDYRFDVWEEVDDFDSDTVTLGAILRFRL